MAELENMEQKRRLNNSMMTCSKIQSGAGEGLLAATTVADTASQVDHRSEMINQRHDSHVQELSNNTTKRAL